MQGLHWPSHDRGTITPARQTSSKKRINLEQQPRRQDQNVTFAARARELQYERAGRC